SIIRQSQIVEVPREAMHALHIMSMISTEEVTPLSILFIYYWLKVVTTDHLDFDGRIGHTITQHQHLFLAVFLEGDSDCRQFSWHEANLFPVTLLSVLGQDTNIEDRPMY
ncbi:hypothetical protein ACJX0J_024589, partial [Zea mays]